MNYLFETNRLRLREFNLSDVKFIIELLNSPGWLEFIGDRNVKTIKQAQNYLKNGPMKSYRENGYGLSMVETREGDKPIGMCGILKREFMDHPDIGFAFLPAFMAKGYAFEIANETINYTRHHLKIPTISAITDEKNVKSIRLLEKIGLKFIKTIVYPDTKEELALYSN